MRICCSLPVALSLAETLTMPLASMSKVTSICGVPRGAGGIPTRSNWPSSLLSAANSRSPWKTRIVAEEVVHRFDHFGHAGHSTDQDHLVDVRGRQPGILERGSAWPGGFFDEIADQLLQLGAGQCHGQMLGTGLIGGYERQIDLG